jgi:polyisoprenoid-binding protein YceI
MCESLFPSKRTGNSRNRGTALLGAVAAALALASGGEAHAAPRIYRVDPDLTSVQFTVSHMGLSRQRGQFDRTRGTIVLDPEGQSGRVDLDIDAASVATGWTARDEFLKSEDMFDAARYPVVRFRSTQLTFDGSRLVVVAGELTMHNFTRPIVLRVARLECGKNPDDGREGCGAEIATSLKRSDFGMSYASGLIGDDIDLSFQVTAFRIPGEGEAERP